ncbi:hypothetical protein MHH81_21135 [Psychrobacillus sp. FSL H8-0484]|uniref:hypothetical protein n=1 Tax=Psychrobacillus sp. FSL H8-0484 TaxID=2921390 RepID=UPI0030FB4F57
MNITDKNKADIVISSGDSSLKAYIEVKRQEREKDMEDMKSEVAEYKEKLRELVRA